jgi:hypothetical protein
VRGTAKTELNFISACAPEYLDRPAPDGETIVLVQANDSDKWRIYSAFVSLPF